MEESLERTRLFVYDMNDGDGKQTGERQQRMWISKGIRSTSLSIAYTYLSLFAEMGVGMSRTGDLRLGCYYMCLTVPIQPGATWWMLKVQNKQLVRWIREASNILTSKGYMYRLIAHLSLGR